MSISTTDGRLTDHMEPRAALLRQTAERAIRYLDGLDARPVNAAPEALARLAGLDEPLPATRS